MPGRVCLVCSRLNAEELVEVNSLLADPSEWPVALLKQWDIPTKAAFLPAKIRQWGGAAVLADWLDAHGYPGTTLRARQAHFAKHVVHVVVNDTEAAKLIAASRQDLRTGSEIIPAQRPKLFIDYYATATQLGLFALQELQRNIEKLKAQGKPIPNRTLWQLADLGAKVATSQAGILARRGGSLDESDDGMGGFREGSAPLPSARFGDSRIRTIEGQSRPIKDRGPADRRDYNATAAQSGSPRLPD